MKRIHVVVPQDQLSLAIGKRGQNARLASQLLGWNIDIRGEGEPVVRPEVAEANPDKEIPSEAVADESNVVSQDQPEEDVVQTPDDAE